MPVRKFRSVEEMPSEIWREPGPELQRAIRDIWEFGDRVLQRRFPPGVYKHKTIEDMQKLADQWEEENVRAHLQRVGLAHLIPSDEKTAK